MSVFPHTQHCPCAETVTQGVMIVTNLLETLTDERRKVWAEAAEMVAAWERQYGIELETEGWLRDAIDVLKAKFVDAMAAKRAE